MGAAISLGVSALATLIFMFLNLSDKPLLELACAVRYLAGGLLVLVMNRIEKKINYSIMPSQNNLPIEESGNK